MTIIISHVNNSFLVWQRVKSEGEDGEVGGWSRRRGGEEEKCNVSRRSTV